MLPLLAAVSNHYGYCQENFFRENKNAVVKRLDEAPADVGKQKPNKQTVPTPSWLRGRKQKDDRGSDDVKGRKSVDFPPSRRTQRSYNT